MSEAQAQGQATPESADTQVEAQPQAQPEAEKSYSQADLNKIAANEKREGRTSAINELLEKTGAESIDDVLSAYSEYSEIQEAVTTEADREKQRADKAEAKVEAAGEQLKAKDERYETLLKSTAVKGALRDAGIKPERLDAVLKLSDLSEVTLEDEEVKGADSVVKQAKDSYPEFFGEPKRPSGFDATPQGDGDLTPQDREQQSTPIRGGIW